jgi:lysophospholipase L1-like esterase
MKILIRGGSIAAGFGVSRSYPHILEKDFASRGISVVNCSRAGETSFAGVESYQDDIAPERPDFLVIHFGIDDAFSAVYRSEFKENLVRMIRLARSEFHPGIFLPTSHLFEDRLEMEAAEIFYRAIREVCTDLGCILVPVHTFWAGQLAETGIRTSDLVQQDSRYPNEKGHEIFADAIKRTLESYFDKTQGRPDGRPFIRFSAPSPLREG